MAGIRLFLRRHTFWAGLFVVLLPLAGMVGLQYVWLTRLQELSAIAHQSALHNYVETVAKEIEYLYRSRAERALNLPASVLTYQEHDKAASFWTKKPVGMARRLFLVDYTREPTGNLYVYDDELHQLFKPRASAESLAIIVACTPWQLLAFSGKQPETIGITSDEHDPQNRILVQPITDDYSRVVGVAGMVLDEDYFRRDVLPEIIGESLVDFFPEPVVSDLLVTVRDSGGRFVYGPRHEEKGLHSVYAADIGFSFVFSDWSLDLHSKGSTPEQWARASFLFNMTLSVLLASVLLGGVVLALRAANRAWRLSEMKSEFVSNVSHELRTPLASIRVFAELLKLGKVPSRDKISEYGGIIESESHRLSRLIDNILDFSRIETKVKTYQFARGDIGRVVDRIMKTFEVRMRQAGFRISLERPDEPLPEIRIDADAITQAMHNLLDNAVKYSADSKDIAVRLTRDNDHVVVSVRDRGIGIARAEQQKIFERFHRVPTGLVHDVKGNGLGLSIVNHIARAHGGTVTVESEPGRGSTFTLRLPVDHEPGAEGEEGTGSKT